MAIWTLVALSSHGSTSRGEPAPAPKSPEELFVTTKVWPLTLTFTPENYITMDPDGGKPPANSGFPGGPGGPGGGPGGPGGGGRQGRGGRGMMSPANFMAPEIIRQADTDKDGKLSEKEFTAFSEKFFDGMDKAKTGTLTHEQFRAGLQAIPRPGGPGGGPGGGGPGFLASEGRRNGLAGAMGIEFKYVHADLEFSGLNMKDIAARYKGNATFMASRNSIKKSLKLDLNKYVKGQKLADEATINLHSNAMDPGWMNEILSHRLYRDSGVAAPRTAYARVHLTVPGKYDKQYIGLYSLVEDVDKKFFKNRTDHDAGAIFKPSTRELFKDLGDNWKAYNQIYDPKSDLTPEQSKRVMDFAKLVTNANDQVFAAQVGDYLDLDLFARYMAVTTWLSTMDSILGMGQNFYVYLDPKSNKFQFVPWDLDSSFGRMGMGQDLDNLSINQPWRGQNRFLER
ncbi:MAG: CotH kinase family protein, partial [Candidatus Methylacidiphilales bacterium]|nr:CotH kinase family protein [Candidatus Methylacidiphilales bacterium]